MPLRLPVVDGALQLYNVPDGTAPLTPFVGVTVNPTPSQIIADIGLMIAAGFTVIVTVNDAFAPQLADVGVTVYVAVCCTFVGLYSVPLMFDWPDPDGARAKIDEELAEVEAATGDAEREEEIGDLLFATVNWAGKLGIDPEAALRSANAKFERRFRAMEESAGDAFVGLDLDAKEALWQRVKSAR